MDHAETCKSSGNVSGSCEESDTPLTQARSLDVRGYVYFIRALDAIKIGHSRDPVLRLSQLQNGSPHTLELLGAFPGTKQTEGELHKLFQDICKNGEWFHDDPDLLSFIEHATGRPIVQIDRDDPPASHAELSAEVRFTTARLINLREKYGSDTPIGHRCSNLIEMLVNFETAEGDQRVGLGKSITRTLDELEKLKADPLGIIGASQSSNH